MLEILNQSNANRISDAGENDGQRICGLRYAKSGRCRNWDDYSRIHSDELLCYWKGERCITISVLEHNRNRLAVFVASLLQAFYEPSPNLIKSWMGGNLRYSNNR